jgi:hypothetical protein
MAIIKIKRGSGVPTGLTYAELAFDATNKKLYIGVTGGSELLTSPSGGVSSVRGITGAVGITNGSGIGLSVSGNTLTVSNTGVLSVNGFTGAIGNVAKIDSDNGFLVAQSIQIDGGDYELFVDPENNEIFYNDLNASTTLKFDTNDNTVTFPNDTGTIALTKNVVSSFNGLTGAVTGVTTGTANTFGPLQSFTNGISSAGGTFSALTRFTAGISASGGITFNSNVTINSPNILNVMTIVSDSQLYLEDTSNARVSIGDYSYNNNSTYIYLRDPTSQLQLSNPFGTIDIGDPNGIDSGNYISYSATDSTLYGNSNSLNGFSDLSANYIYALSGISASGGVTLSGPLNIRNTLLINGSQGSNNQVLTSTGIGITWAAVPAGFSRSINIITSSTTAGSTANIDYVYNGNTSGNINLTLPTAVSNTNRYTVKNSNIGILTVLTTSSQTIDGITGYALSKQYQAIDLLSDNSNWFIV